MTGLPSGEAYDRAIHGRDVSASEASAALWNAAIGMAELMTLQD